MSSFINPSLSISSLSQADLDLCESLSTCGQKEVLASFTTPEQIKNFLDDARMVNANYPGGISKYVDTAKGLLRDSALNVNAFDGFKVEVPSGVNLDYKKGDFDELEKLGKEMLKYTGFSLVGGGIGERLGSKFIKLSLTSDLVRNQTFLEDYCNYIHAIEMEHNSINPFAIMTSDGTNDGILSLLKQNNYYGLHPDHVTLMKQNGVPALKNSACAIATKEDGHIILKPHGHGDIHLLMNQNHLPEQWRQLGMKYVIFFQDTNGLSMHGYPLLLGVAEKYGYDFCSMTIVRKPGEKVGGICRLVNNRGEALTCNVEYNQLEGVLKASTGAGDVANADGNSDYPGNINLLCIRLENYEKVLERSGGVVSEFVNPKYADASRTAFLSPVRLECMMQDYPKLLFGSASPVGFVSLPRWMCFSAVKNSRENGIKQAKATGYPESFFSGEEDIYKFYRRVLRQHGVQVGDAAYDEALTQAVGLPRFPIVVMTSRSGLVTSDIVSHFGKNVVIRDKSVLLVDGKDVFFQDFVLDGALTVKACDGAKVVIRNCAIQNKSWHAVEVNENDESVEERYALRGYMIVKDETRELVFDKPGEYVVEC